MELTTSHFIQFIMVIATLAGSFQMIKSNLEQVKKETEKIIKELEEINIRIDRVESESAVIHHQVKILGSILSPDHLAKSNREIAEMKAHQQRNSEMIMSLVKMHNGEHKKTG